MQITGQRAIADHDLLLANARGHRMLASAVPTVRSKQESETNSRALLVQQKQEPVLAEIQLAPTAASDETQQRRTPGRCASAAYAKDRAGTAVAASWRLPDPQKTSTARWPLHAPAESAASAPRALAFAFRDRPARARALRRSGARERSWPQRVHCCEGERRHRRLGGAPHH